MVATTASVTTRSSLEEAAEDLLLGSRDEGLQPGQRRRQRRQRQRARDNEGVGGVGGGGGRGGGSGGGGGNDEYGDGLEEGGDGGATARVTTSQLKTC